MDNKRYLLDQIKKCRRKMNLAKAIDHGVLYAAAGGVFGIFCELYSLFLPFYHVHSAAVSCFGTGLLIGVCRAVYRRAHMRQAAGRLDSFGLKERMLTAYENLEKEDTFALLQRQDACAHYDRIREKIRIPLLPDRRHILALLAAAVTVAGMSFIPSPTREQAALLHEVKEQTKEEKEELEAFLDALERVDMESLTQEQQAKLQELLDTMELSRDELAGADSSESLSAATGRLDYKYQQAAQSLEQLAGQLEYPEAAGVASAEAFARAKADGSGQQMASAGTTDAGAGGENGAGDGEGSGHEEGRGEADENGEESGQSGASASGGDGQSGGSGQGEGSSSGGGEGQGGDNDSGNGNGQGNKSASGSGTGGGRGIGSSDAAHDYVSIPNAVADDSSLNGNKNGDQDSDYYRRQNGLAWEGDHVDYNAVIGEYTDSAYEGIANGRYPSGMESVIRDYFENLNK